MQDTPPKPPSPASPPPSPLHARRGYGALADKQVDLYEALHLHPRAPLPELEDALKQAQRWWNGQQANPKYRRQAPDALARLTEAREILFDPIRRQEYDRTLQAFRRSYRELRWQPIRDLVDLLLEDGTCDHQRQHLIVRFAKRRGLQQADIETMLGEEFLRRNIEWIDNTTAPISSPSSQASIRPKYNPSIAMLSLSFVGLLLLPFFGEAHNAILLFVPFINTARLLAKGLYLPKTTPTQTNLWGWFVGIVVLGGATLTSLFSLQHSSAFPIGLFSAVMLWSAWLALTILWEQRPLEQPPSAKAAQKAPTHDAD